MLARLALLVLASASFACAPADPLPPPGDVQPVVEAFYASLSAFDLEGLDTLVTGDFEIVDGGRRMDATGFASFMTGLRGQGLEFDFAFSEWSTRVEGHVAYTLLTSVNQPVDATFYESAILLWDGSAWRIDRFHSTPAR